MSERMQKILSRLKRDEKTNIIKEQIQKKKEISIRDMLKITRSLNESDDSEDNDDVIDIKTSYDQEEEEKKFRNFFDDLNVHIDFIPLEIWKKPKSGKKGVFWGGTIDGIIQFVYKVTDNDETSGVSFNYLREGYEDNDMTKEIVDRVKSYYDTFYKYWNKNLPER